MKKKKTRHHLVNRCNGGDNDVANILRLFDEKHRAWHLLFKNLDIEGAIEVLQRVKSLKQKGEIENALQSK